MAEDTGPARRGRPGHDQETVVRRAVEVFNRQGYDGTSMSEVAAELGIAKSALYHHVPGKEALLAAALDEALDALSAAIDVAGRPDSAPTAEARLRAALDASVRVLATHLPAVTLLLRVRGNSEVEQTALRRRRDLDDRLAALVAEAVAEGAVRADLPADLAGRLLFGMVNSLVEWYRPDGPLDADTLAATVVSLAFGGLGIQPDGDPLSPPARG